MAGEIAAEWIKIPDGNGGFNKVWVRDSTARRSVAQLQEEVANLSAADVGAIPLSQKGAASGVAELDANGLVLSSQLPSYVDDVLEYASSASFPATGETGKIYVDLGTNLTYRWSGSAYVEISPSLALGTTSSTAFRGDHGNTAYEHAVNKGSAFASGLYKITTNAEGHITGAVAVAKADITALGIPGSAPSKTSDLTNDSGFLTSVPVQSVNGQTGTVTLSASDVGAQGQLSSAQLAAVNSGITADNLAVNDASVLCTVTPIVPTLSSGTHNSTYGGCYYYKIGHRVHVHIGVGGLTSNNTFNLWYMPAGYKPYSMVSSIGTGTAITNYGRVRIAEDGLVSISANAANGCADIEYDAFA